MISDTNLYDINILNKSITIVRVSNSNARGYIRSSYHDEYIIVIYPPRAIISIRLESKIDPFEINITEKDYDFIYKTHDLNILSLYIINLINKNKKKC